MRAEERHVFVVGEHHDRRANSPASVQQNEPNLALEYASVRRLEPLDAGRRHSNPVEQRARDRAVFGASVYHDVLKRQRVEGPRERRNRDGRSENPHVVDHNIAPEETGTISSHPQSNHSTAENDCGRIRLVTVLGASRRVVGRAELLFPRRAEQTMVMPAISRRWTRQEVLDLIEQNPLPLPRYELVDGVLLVTPAPTHTHQSAVGTVYLELTLYLRAEPGIGEAFVSPSTTEPEPEAVVQPDVYVVPIDEARRVRLDPNARVVLLAIEVLSPRDPSGDRTRKRALYQRTVPEYWIVDHKARHIEVWRPGDTEPHIARARLEWNPAGASKPFVLDVTTYFSCVHGETL
jgi:Uma2 family endonuclease